MKKTIVRIAALAAVAVLVLAQQPSPLGSPPNAQTGTTYTFAATDCGRLVTFSNASAVAVTLPVATGTGFGAGCWIDATNYGVGTVTVTPTTSTINNGAATYTLTTNQGVRINSDGTNYQVQPGKGSGLPDTAGNGLVVRTASLTTTNRSMAATAPVTISNADGTAGNPTYACATCATTTNGGALSATTPLTISAAGVIADPRAAVNTQTFSSTPAYNLSLGEVQTITLTGNVTSSTFTNGVAGEIYTFIICQDGTGGRTYAWGAAWHGTMTVGSTLSLCSTQQFAALNATTLYSVAPGIINQ